MKKIIERLFEAKSPEHQFLPAVLEVQQTPPSPIGRAVLWSIVLFLTLMLIWSIIGKVDIIAIAPGKIIPNDRVKTIQPLENAVVTKILVKDGDAVKKGDVLVVLDSRQTQSDVDNLEQQRQEKDARLTALNQLDLMISPGAPKKIPALHFSDTITSNIQNRQQSLFNEQVEDFRSALASSEHAIKKQREDMATSGSEVTKLEHKLPLMTKKAETYHDLVSQNAVGEIEYLDQEQQRIEMSGSLDSERLRSKSLKAALDQAIEGREKLIFETRVTYGKEKYELVTQLGSINQELNKANAKNGLQTLTSPIDGVVQGMTVFTIGGVVTQAEKIMQVVPVDGGLEIEAMVSNKDIGFVHENQSVTIKIDSFNFTKYGTIEGSVLSVSKDAFQDDKLGLIFKTRIKMKTNIMLIDGSEINLVSGMSISSEIKSGSRKIIEFILNPICKVINEAWHER